MGCGNHCIVIMYIMKPCSIKFYFQKLPMCSCVCLNRRSIQNYIIIYRESSVWIFYGHDLCITCLLITQLKGIHMHNGVLISGVKWLETYDTAFSRFVVLVPKCFVQLQDHSDMLVPPSGMTYTVSILTFTKASETQFLSL